MARNKGNTTMQASNLVGQILGNYRLINLLGKGGYAEVYLAEHANLPLKEKYAIKILKKQDLEGYQREEFRVEANLMATLVHKRIAKVQDYGFHKNMPYLVMEYAPGGTLRKVHPHGSQMPFQQIVLYVKQMAEALQFAHDQKPSIVHRDVKPENMLVRGPNDIILSDFGIAITGLNTGNLQEQQEALLRKMARNENVMVPGTASYIAPERLLGKTQRASDQYSLAVVVYEWLCGRRPFTGNDVDICNKHVSTPPPPLVGVYPRITPEIERVVMKGLAKEPEQRYRTVTEFANALEVAMQPTAYQVQSPPLQHTPLVMPLTPVQPTPVTPLSSPLQQQNSSSFNQNAMGQVPIPSSPQVLVPPEQEKTPPRGIPIVHLPINQPPSLLVPNSNPLPLAAPTPLPPPSASAAPSVTMPFLNQAQDQGQRQAFATAAPPPAQPQPWWNQGAPYVAFPNSEETVSTFTKRSTWTEIKGEVNDFLSKPLDSAGRFVETDVFFTRLPQYRWVFPLGVATNMLGMFIYLFSSVAYSSWVSSILVALLGFVVSLFCFRQCLITVKKITAIAYGVIVAMWWWIVIATLFKHVSPASAIVAGIIAFMVGVGVHVWHVSTRLKN